MASGRDGVGDICFAVEGMAGTAAASSLRRVRSLADAAPSGRLFGAISTLSDLSKKSEKHLRAADEAMAANDSDRAIRNLARALTAMDDMATGAEGMIDIPDLLPDMKRLRS